jgi:hypothetical protein
LKRSWRARITSIDSRSLDCRIDPNELTDEEASINLKDGESSFPEWIQKPTMKSFRLVDPELVEKAKSVGDRNVILTVEDGTVVDIKQVREGPVCHFCNERRFTSDFVHEALCNRRSCRYLIDELFVVTKPRERDEMWGGDTVDVQSRYVYQTRDGKRVYTPWGITGRRGLVGREFFHVYRAHKAKICTTCEGNQEVWKLSDLQKHLQAEFEQNKRTYNVTGAVVTE